MRKPTAFPLRIPRALLALRKTWLDGYGYQPVTDRKGRVNRADLALGDTSFLEVPEDSEDRNSPKRYLITCQCGSQSWQTARDVNRRDSLQVGCGFCSAAAFGTRIYSDPELALHIQHHHALMLVPGLLPGVWGGTMDGEQLPEEEGRTNFVAHLFDEGLPRQWCPFLHRISDQYGYGIGNIDCSPYPYPELFPREDLLVLGPEPAPVPTSLAVWAAKYRLSQHLPEMYEAFVGTTTCNQMTLILSQYLELERPKPQIAPPPPADATLEQQPASAELQTETPASA